jgi:serine protease Do
MNNLVQYGKMIRGYLGVLIQDITPELSDYFKMETVRGALISEVIPDSPAEEAGMRDGDVVLSVNGLDVLNKDSFRSRIAQTPPGEKVALKILRSGKESTLYPVLAELNEDSPVDGFGSPTKRQSQGLDREFHQDSALQGLELSEISNDLRQKFGIPGDVSGVVILRVDNSSPLARTRLSAGDVVLSVNQINVKSLRDINNALNTHGKSNVLLKILSAQSRYRATQYIVLKK